MDQQKPWPHPESSFEGLVAGQRLSRAFRRRYRSVAEDFHAAETTGGVEFYLVEQEGSDHSEMETAELCLANFRKLRA